MNHKKTHQHGFTVIELVVVVAILVAASILTFVQINNLTVANHNTQRKTAINAMYYSLEEVYFKQNQGYPSVLNASTLPSVDSSLFTDPDGFTLGKDSLSEQEMKQLEEKGELSPELKKMISSIQSGKVPNYRYEPRECDLTTNICKGYTLRAQLVGEAEYIKKNRS
jgi:prepilin-type N-terminal cleavage/methylation domain-containing protein